MKPKSIKILNRKAFHDYAIIEKIEAGIALQGSEVKSIREGAANLKGAYVKFDEKQAEVVGMHISPYIHSTLEKADPLRIRRLLLHKKEIARFFYKTQEKKLTAIPLSLYFKKGFVKLEIALVKGRKLYDKRENLKKKADFKELNMRRRG
ncbi:MAG: SsrA-binding protein SmpB [bacterium]